MLATCRLSPRVMVTTATVVTRVPQGAPAAVGQRRGEARCHEEQATAVPHLPPEGLRERAPCVRRHTRSRAVSEVPHPCPLSSSPAHLSGLRGVSWPPQRCPVRVPHTVSACRSSCWLLLSFVFCPAVQRGARCRLHFHRHCRAGPLSGGLCVVSGVIAVALSGGQPHGRTARCPRRRGC